MNIKNGFFAFYVNGNIELLDFEPHNIDWHEFKLDLEPGDYTFGWIYKVYNYD